MLIIVRPCSLSHHFPVFSLFKTDLQAIADNWLHILEFLYHLCKSEDLVVQLWYLRNLDNNTREPLQNTIFGNEILIAYAHVYSGYKNHKIGMEKVYSNCATTMVYYYLKYVTN